jgi:hypothetical protein
MLVTAAVSCSGTASLPFGNRPRGRQIDPGLHRDVPVEDRRMREGVGSPVR